MPVLCIQIDEETQLRLIEERYAEEYYALIERNKEHLRTWMSWVNEENSAESNRSYIKHMLQQFANNQGFQMGIWYQGQLVGSIAFNDMDWGSRKVEIGYWLASDMQGKGLMTKACRTLIAYAFEEYKLHKVVIRVSVDNRRSRAIPERLGFTQEGIIRHEEWLHDRYTDTVIYGLLASEWENEKET